MASGPIRTYSGLDAVSIAGYTDGMMHTTDQHTVTIKGADLRVGDRIEFLGQYFEVDRIAPYGRTSMPDIITPDTTIAYSGPTWGITVFADGTYRILPRNAS